MALISVILQVRVFAVSTLVGFPGHQGLSQELETGCPKLTIAKVFGIPFFKGDQNNQ